MRTPIRTLLPGLLAAGLAVPAAAQDRPPTGKKLDDLLERFLAADGKTDAGFAEQQQVLAEVAKVPALAARDVDKWKKKIEKLWRKGRKLEKSGDNWFFENKTGRYIVGGKNETKKPKGLAINMHGGGVGSGDAGPAASAYGPALSGIGYVMIAPEVLERTECGWTDSGTEEFVLDLIDCALRTWQIDPDHVVLVGHSMGGYGSWTLGGHHADRLAAIAPSAGAPTPIQRAPGGPIIDIIEGVVPSLRNVYISCYQSTDDPQVPPEPNQYAIRALIEAHKKWGGYEHEYWEVSDRGHGAPPGGHEAHVEKIVDKVRNPIPERVVWQPVLPWKRQFYWLYWDAPVANAVVVADLDRANNSVKIECDKPTAGMSVLLDERVLDLGKEIVVTVNGTETFRGMVEPNLQTLLLTSDHPDPKLQFVATAKAH
ncbi:MAG: alpha/beta fold hydrolase [Planctomycetes bacterium]|nr:alpha/beta fold hydrolase [Planctomycetota bacterium]